MNFIIVIWSRSLCGLGPPTSTGLHIYYGKKPMQNSINTSEAVTSKFAFVNRFHSFNSRDFQTPNVLHVLHMFLVYVYV